MPNIDRLGTLNSSTEHKFIQEIQHDRVEFVSNLNFRYEILGRFVI